MPALPSSVLLDTCAMIWLAAGSPMSEESLAAIRNAGVTMGIWISPASAWEIGLLSRPRKNGGPGISFMPDPAGWFLRVLTQPGMRLASFTPAIAIGASYLPGEFHADPADRMIVSTARHLGMPIVTRDAKIHAYASSGQVAALAC